MKKITYILLVLLLGLSSCSKDEDALVPSDKPLFPHREITELDKQIIELFKGYNVRVEFRYIENLLPKEWYYITPPKEEIVFPICEMLFNAWLTPLVEGSSKEFVRQTFPKQIVLVGSQAKQKDGTVVLGQAEGGQLIRFTEANDFTETNVDWMRRQLHTAYHEYCHIIHQTFILPDEYREVTPDNYTQTGWRVVNLTTAITKGMVTPYGTSNASEDFVEMFSCYITYPQKNWDYIFNDETLPDDPVELIPESQRKADPAALKAQVEQAMLDLVKRNEGRTYIRKKFQILDKFLVKHGVNMHTIREEVQKYLAAAAAKKPAA
ncbi:putative zinc-binding metallopeptidase [Prolixibacteraceae bacterium]|nr:putative zinc-binding metallopeptidase [Prolixibacteraceae bacterium]